jgi:DNA-nicking Smr family endonuclease
VSDDELPEDAEAPVELPIDGDLDLHTFRPRDVPALLEEYLAACHAKGILDVRIAHGKGSGALRRRVHAQLARMAEVESFRSADALDGGWGVTWVRLRPPELGPSGGTGEGACGGAQSSQK